MTSPSKKLASLGLAPSKARGQNFIKEPFYADKVAKVIIDQVKNYPGPITNSPGLPLPNSTVTKAPENDSAQTTQSSETLETTQNIALVEIGPGLGTLTKRMLQAGFSLTAVEVDRGLAKELSQWTIEEKKLKVLCQDILTLNLENDLGKKPYLVFGNLPYNLSTPILFWFMDQAQVAPMGIFMLQKEMAQTLTSKPNSRDYGRLSVAFSLWYEVRTVYHFPPEAFLPRPKVDSSLVSLKLKGQPPTDKERAALGRLTAAAFFSRRKTIQNNLKARYGPEKAVSVLEKLQIDPQRRPETLDPTTFSQLAQLLEN
ncbi:MAG: 16S rRNA (adenine(1518)-N(6)/adenine(1519)-N(6))-dimethyltransferase RsmA [Deltaproteobacteria bacterium]|jgi:16S rRNA (adenine1518-N6/adenine1519-N6)-dimethyltransferase|nr:16S rRNA (adenine(1518)-N(6)/adenine(1519)-N(6))-dimethyltransferase RsmA [Deltaproteobacteria bacterium]